MNATHKSIGLVGVQASAGINTKLDAFLFFLITRNSIRNFSQDFPQKNVH